MVIADEVPSEAKEVTAIRFAWHIFGTFVPVAMPRPGDFPLFDRPPSYGFEQFDELMRRLRAAVSDTDVFAEVLATLQLEGRDLDTDHLARELHLDHALVAIIERLAAWGDRGELTHHFACVRIATINSGSLVGMCDLSTMVVAERREDGVALFYEDENGGHGDVGVYQQPLSLLELIVVTDGVLLVQAPYPTSSADWRDHYLDDETMRLTVRSPFYEPLQRWYEESVREWRETHGNNRR